jgi:hypothetical protein
MTKMRILLFVSSLMLASASATLASGIVGDYLEVRSADVYTGPCIANSEVGLAGDEAIVAWYITDGDWSGVPLKGLSVVGVVKASGTLGDPFHNAYPAKTLLIVDATASPEQKIALQSFAQSMAPELLKNVIRVETASIKMEIGDGMPHGCARLEAGALAIVETRCLDGKDHLCGNEVTFYPPLVALDHAMPAFALRDEFNGTGLNVNWQLADRRSAFIGSFSQHVTTVAMK